jgi:polyisoprenoid-binding protein YceI
MKAPVLAAAALAAAAGLSFLPVDPAAPAQAAGTSAYAIDNVHSTVIFRVKHLDIGISYGRFNEISGTLAHDQENPKASSIELSVKADSVDTNSQERDEHLKSPDFLSVKEFPAITFKSTKVEKKGEDMSVTGDLTLHGVTKPVTARVTHAGRGKDPWGNDRLGFEARFEVDPKDFEIRFMTDKPDMLGPGLEVIVSLEATRKPE